MKRVPIAIICLVLSAVLAMSSAGIGQAAAATLSDVHMARLFGPGQPPVASFPSGTVTVSFDYTVDVASPTDTGLVQIYRANDMTAPYAQTSIGFEATGPQSVTVPSPDPAYPDGQYCTVLLINGVQQSDNGLPLAWTVGSVTQLPACQNPLPVVTTATDTTAGPATATATVTVTSTPVTPAATATIIVVPTGTITPVLGSPIAITAAPTLTGTPAATPALPRTSSPTPVPPATTTPTETAPPRPKTLRVDTSGTLRAHRSASLRVHVHGTHGRPISGVTVRFDGTSVGIGKRYHAKTGSHGYVTFRNLKPSRKGKVLISASKTGYRPLTVPIPVR